MLYALWDKLVIPADGHWASREESLVLIYTRARNRSRRVLEHLFRAYSTEVLEAVVDCWCEQVAVGLILFFAVSTQIYCMSRRDRTTSSPLQLMTW